MLGDMVLTTTRPMPFHVSELFESLTDFIFTIVWHDHVRNSKLWKCFSQFLDCCLTYTFTHYVCFYPFGMHVHNYEKPVPHERIHIINMWARPGFSKQLPRVQLCLGCHWLALVADFALFDHFVNFPNPFCDLISVWARLFMRRPPTWVSYVIHLTFFSSPFDV